jgi:hypothetical protein
MVRPRANARIARAGGTIIPGTSEWMSSSLVDKDGRARDAPQTQVFVQPMTQSIIGARFEISVDGIGRTNRDRKEIAIEAGQVLKSKNPNAQVDRARSDHRRDHSHQGRAVATMTLLLRRMVWPDGKYSMDPEDYQVIADGQVIGRIHRSNSTARVKWEWGIHTEARRGPPRPWNGMADSLDEAKAAFKAAWERSS